MSTKSLAKELGLIRRRSQSSGAHQSRRKQRFSFLIIIDFESTCWKEKNSFRPEIIEFPAVLLNLCNGAVESEFHSFVQPQEQPVLSGFCSQLTGITQDQVDSAPPLHICLSRFVRWLQGLQQERGVAYETDSSGPAPSGHACAFVTWSDWDLGVCLLYECKRKQLRVPGALKSWIDLRATYRLFYNRKPKGLRGALLDLGIQFSGREHSGLVDARNTALLAWRMVCDGCCLTVTKSLQRALVKARPQRGNISAATSVCADPQTSVCADPQTSVCRSPPSVCADPQTSVCRSAPSVCADPQMSVCRSAPSVCADPQTSVCRSAPSVCADPQTSVCRALVSPVTVLSSTHTTLGKISYTALAGLSDTTYDPETPDACWSDGVLLIEEGEEPVHLGEEPVHLEEEPVHLEEEPVHLGEGPVRLGEESVPLEEGPVYLGEGPVRLGVEPVRLGAWSVHLREEPVPLGKEPVPLGAEPVRLGEEPVRLGEEPVRLGAWSVHLREEPVPLGKGPVLLGAWSVPLREEPVPLGKEPVPLGKEPVRLGEGPVHLGKEPVRLGAEPVHLGEEPVPLREEPVPLGAWSVRLRAEPDENHPIKTTSDRLKPTVSCASTSLFKTPRPVPHTLSHTHSHTHTDPYGPLSRFLGHAPFSVHRDTPPSTPRDPPPRRPRPPAAASLPGKRTAPLCECGRRARRQTVGNGGPNHGRVFFCCPVSRPGCGFFQWQSGLTTARTHTCRSSALR